MQRVNPSEREGGDGDVFPGRERDQHYGSGDGELTGKKGGGVLLKRK